MLLSNIFHGNDKIFNNRIKGLNTSHTFTIKQFHYEYIQLTSKRKYVNTEPLDFFDIWH